MPPLTYRHLLLPEEGITMETTFLLCSLSSLMPQPGHPLPSSHVGCGVPELRLWEAGSGWMGVRMVQVLPDMRWKVMMVHTDGFEIMKMMIFSKCKWTKWGSGPWWSMIKFPCLLLLRCWSITLNLGTSGSKLLILKRKLAPCCAAYQMRVIIIPPALVESQKFFSSAFWLFVCMGWTLSSGRVKSIKNVV